MTPKFHSTFWAYGEEFFEKICAWVWITNQIYADWKKYYWSAKCRYAFELLSQYKETGLYRISLSKLKTLLGFVIYDFEAEPKQLNLFDEGREPTKEFLKTWYDFSKSVLRPSR